MKLEKSTYLLIFIIFLSIFIKLFLLHPTFSDENFYFNVGKNVLEDKVLYKEFFFGHPPLQIYLTALFFKILGVSFLVGKLIPLISSSLCVLLVYMISKEFNSKFSFVSALILLITPSFIAFSTQAYGMWEASLFILLSIYLIFRNKLIESSFTFLIAVLFRYISLLYLPLILILIIMKNYKIKTFLISFLLISIIASLFLILIFGENIIKDTIIFQIKNTGVRESQEYFTSQYLGIGSFFIFLGILSSAYTIKSKNKVLTLFSIYPIIADIIIFFLIREIAYHYFIINLVLYMIPIGKAFSISKDKIFKISILVILLLAILSNIQTIDFYLNPKYSERYYSIASFIENSTSVNDSIFGEPVITNYISFEANRRISSNYLDSYLRHLKFEGEQKVVENLEKDKPKIFIEMNNYYLSNSYFRDFILNNYVFERKFEGIINYSIYKLKT